MARRIVVNPEDGYPTHAPASAADRSQIAKIAANTRWSRTEDRSAATQAARDGLMRRFENEVDPEGRLPAAERARRAESAKRAHFQRMALKSAQTRRAKRKGGTAAKPVDSDGT